MLLAGGSLGMIIASVLTHATRLPIRGWRELEGVPLHAGLFRVFLPPHRCGDPAVARIAVRGSMDEKISIQVHS
jgi:hypothetical protein